MKNVLLTFPVFTVFICLAANAAAAPKGGYSLEGTGSSRTKLSTETFSGEGNSLGGSGISFGSGKDPSSSGKTGGNSGKMSFGQKSRGKAEKKCDKAQIGIAGPSDNVIKTGNSYYWDCEKKCPKVGWPALVKTGTGYFSDSQNWGFWYSGDGYSGPPLSGPDAEFNGSYMPPNIGIYMRGAYSSWGHWYNQCNGSSQSPWYPNSKGVYDIPPETVCTTTHDRAAIMKKVAKECSDRAAYVKKYYESQPTPPAPPPAMTNAEKIEWFCAQPANQGPSCEARARALVSYISDYAKYPGLDVRGQPIIAPPPPYFFDPDNW